MTGMRKTEFSVIDVETTGLNTRNDEIVAIAIVPMTGTRIHAFNTFYTLLRPTGEVKAMNIHGLTPDALKNAPDFDSMASEIVKRLENRILIGHAVEIDVSFLKKHLKKAGFKMKFEHLDIAEIEQWLADRLGERKILSEYSLDRLAERYGVKIPYRHNALADAFVTAQIFQIQLLRLMKYGINSLDRLIKLLQAYRNYAKTF